MTQASPCILSRATSRSKKESVPPLGFLFFHYKSIPRYSQSKIDKVTDFRRSLGTHEAAPMWF
ncbi:uncharacterized protein G2W53_014458 [Senna tora]|uniref:Uncharacterized protein n=1 Tax=Senna tora TaxID=362788 RepID=A0A835C5P8_9FABA|nr:uncharacterized protein G2W53_014458 [Senna tora]